MNNSSSILIKTLGLSFGFITAACSLNEAWNPEYLNNTHCDQYNKCALEGYTCSAGANCILDHSQTVNTTCLYDINCKEGLVCPTNIQMSNANHPDAGKQNGFTCRNQCFNYFTADTICGDKEFCRGLYENDDQKKFANKGACMPGDCNITKADFAKLQAAGESTKEKYQCSGANDDCIVFKTDVGVCFKTCSYKYVDGKYTDTATALGRACHPLGTSSANMKMIEQFSGTKHEGENCDPFASPCEKGLVCIKGKGQTFLCHQLCTYDAEDPSKSAGCTKPSACNPLTLTGDNIYSYCSQGTGNIMHSATDEPIDEPKPDQPGDAGSETVDPGNGENGEGSAEEGSNNGNENSGEGNDAIDNMGAKEA